ncbi:hypothetical protein DL763_007034 [Monosporascus cannonballus]|nr:hypothetical protein DL763_007034 [Monosporascus cannonballus]
MEYPDVPERSPSPSPSPSPTASPTIPDRPTSPELPLTMTASAVLTSLPRDASSALASAAGEYFDSPGQDSKVVVRFKAVGSAPQLRREVRKISAAQRFEAVVAHLRKALRLGDADGLFLYINSAFAPALDEVVGNLHRCFKDSNDQLIVVYSITPAFG